MMVLILTAPLCASAQVDMPNPGGFGQFGGLGNIGNQQNDTTKNNKKWSNPPPVIHYKNWNSDVKLHIDSSIHQAHVFDTTDNWTYNLGNVGTATQSFLFRSENEIGPQLNYNNYKPYLNTKYSVPFFNTTRPYSLFSYSLGSQQEQLVSILHTQNLNPRLNMAIYVRNINSPGFFNNLLSINNSGYYTANYISIDQKYKAHGAIIYNKMRNDENGGILDDSLLLDNRFVNSRQIPTHINSTSTSRRRSRVTNTNREIHGFYTHEYRIGQTDTIYNEDSTKYDVQFTPQWSFRHDFDVNFRKHSYEDNIPDKNNYLIIDPTIDLLSNDTIRHNQHLNTIQNNFTVNGFVGKYGKQIHVEAGIGNRIDVLKSVNRVNDHKSTFVNNYLLGQIRKEALEPTQWSYGAHAVFYFAGSHIGDMSVDGFISKQFKNIGAFRLYGSQTVNAPAYNFTEFNTNFFTIKNEFSKTSHTHFQAQILIEKINLLVRLNNHTLYNHIYLTDDYLFKQYDQLINVSNIEVKHRLKVGKFALLSDVFLQKKNADAPVNLPDWGISETITFSNGFYADKLLMTSGIRFRYIGSYQRVGYNYLFNQFHFNESGTATSDAMELMAYLNFRVKNLTMFFTADQIQQLWINKNVSYVESYPLPQAMYRFGFKWTLFN